MKTDKEDIQKDSNAVSEKTPTKERELRHSDAEIRFGDIGEEEVEDEPVDQTGAGDMPGGNRGSRRILSESEIESAFQADDARLQSRDVGDARFGALGVEQVAQPTTPKPEALELGLSSLIQHLETAEPGTGISSREEMELCRRSEEKIESLSQRKWRELPADIDPHDLKRTGWGVIFALGESPAIHEQLRPLLRRREDQAGPLYRQLTYYSSESPSVFLWNRHGETPGVFSPKNLPYYLLIVGSPEKIPFEFQYQLATNHAVGRIFFDDIEDYGHYARAIVETEREGGSLSRKATLFAVERNDWVTDLLARHLVAPLHEDWKRLAGDWDLGIMNQANASSENLARHLGSPDTAGLLLVSCHGERYDAGDPDQKRYQGTLICQKNGDRFSADQVPQNARLHGQIAFLFNCYGAGTPVRNNFPYAGKKGESEILAEEPFIARLPQALLSRGASACIGHVDRGWTTSFAWIFGDQEVPAVLSLKDTLLQLLKQGHRLGHAMRPLVRRYTAIAAALAIEIELQDPSEEKDRQARQRRALQWTALNDARNFIVLGDPAVYILGGSKEHKRTIES